ncbi:hypothetical protein [Variovorax sp. JS1663]|uniref:hypothetical protein n=1 Tax=Variovorax sp. JS1663 TaxID=1851577 RepID=UPI000B341DFC|nr:hypothetical protein [Variovorax sp. JS1663]OUM01738.1 hypothetical protein A8M77_14345 [Variovorax sp. JS1663]
MWQPEIPTLQLGKPLSHSQEWQLAFADEWCRLAEGMADEHQVYDLANELYPVHGARDPVEVAREDWDTPA